MHNDAMATAKVKKVAPRAAKKAVTPAEVSLSLEDPQIADVAALVRSVGGAPIGAYRDPLGGRALNSDLAWVAVGAGAQD